MWVDRVLGERGIAAFLDAEEFVAKLRDALESPPVGDLAVAYEELVLLAAAELSIVERFSRADPAADQIQLPVKVDPGAMRTALYKLACSPDFCPMYFQAVAATAAPYLAFVLPFPGDFFKLDLSTALRAEWSSDPVELAVSVVEVLTTRYTESAPRSDLWASVPRSAVLPVQGVIWALRAQVLVLAVDQPSVLTGDSVLSDMNSTAARYLSRVRDQLPPGFPDFT